MGKSAGDTFCVGNGELMALTVYNGIVRLVMAMVLLLVLAATIQQRSAIGTSRWLAFSPDTREYVSMVRGEPAVAPFAARILVPRLAALLPLPPLQALRAITYAALIISYVVLLQLLGQLGVPFRPALLALVAMATSTRQLLLVQNPYLTDGFSFFAMSLMLACFLTDRPGPFAVTAIIGGLAREDCLFGAASFLATHRRRAGFLITVAAVATYLLPRWGGEPVRTSFLGFAQLSSWQYYAKAYFALGCLWPLMLLGLTLAWNSSLRRIVWYFVMVLTGSLVSTLFAIDTTRMFLPVLPVAMVLSALTFEYFCDNRGVMALWLVFLALNVVLALPTVLFPGSGQIGELEEWYYRLKAPLIIYQVAGFVLVWVSWRLMSP